MYDEVHIVSGGKTGNQTLTMSFRRLFPRAFVGYCHSCVYLKKSLLKEGRRRLVVNSYREPVSRMISSLFHNVKKIHIPTFQFRMFHGYNYPIVKQRLNRYMDAEDYFEWYHPLDEVVDLSQLPPFDKERKWSLYRLPEFDLLLLRFDQIHHWETQIQEIFPSFTIVPCNVSSQKKYGGLYDYFRQKYHLHPNFKTLFERDREKYDFYFTPTEMEEMEKKLFSIRQ